MIRWSPSSIELALDCSLAYYYEKIKKIKVPVTGRMAAGTFMHRRAELFFSEYQRFKSSDGYSGSVAGLWKRNVVKEGMIRGEKIRWSDEKEPYILAAQIKTASKIIYETLLSEGRPLFPPEYKYDFMLDGKHFVGKMDAMPIAFLIRDYKFREFDNSKPRNIIKLHNDIQATAYIMAYSVLANKYKSFRDKLGLTKEEEEALANDPLYLMDRVKMEFFSIIGGVKSETTRNKQDYVHLKATVDDLENRIENGIITPNKKHCAYCRFNEICPGLINTVFNSGELKIKQLELFEPNPKNNLLKIIEEDRDRPVLKKPIQLGLKF